MNQKTREWFSGLLALLFCGSPGAVRAAGPNVEVVAVHRASVPTKPDDVAWKSVPMFTAALLQQDMVEPRLIQASTDKVEVRAVNDGKRIAFRLEWADPSKDDLPGVV